MFPQSSYEKQRKTLQDGVDILIGTPGRIIDYFKQGVFKLNQVEVAVLDEADRMIDMGFAPQIESVLDAMGAALKSEVEPSSGTDENSEQFLI